MSNGHQTTSTLAKGQLEVCGDPDLLTGTATASLVEEGCAPGTIIRRDRPWRVDLCWTLKGSLKRMICGYWCTHVHLESIGEGPEFSLPTTGDEFEFKGCDPKYQGDGELVFKHSIAVPAGKVPVEACGTPYKLVATIIYKDSCETPGPIAGFVELPIVLFYDPGTSN